MSTKVLAALAASLLSFWCATPMPAAAQNLTPDAVANGFVEAVQLCAEAKIAGGGIAQLPEADRARVADAGAQGMAFVSVPEGRPVWDVLSARGIVVISEPNDNECDVTAYGPPVRPVFDRVANALTGDELGFAETATTPDPSSILRGFERTRESGRVSVFLDGGEPGMPGRVFRFPLLLAFVRTN